MNNPDLWQRKHWRTETRYYSAHLQQDLFGNWVILRGWGGLRNRISNSKMETHISLAEAQSRLNEIAKQRKYKNYRETA